MKAKLLIVSSFALSLIANAEDLEIRAEFDTSLDFWASYTGSFQDNQQGYVSNSTWGPFASEDQFKERYEYIGHFIRFDLSGVTPERVNAADFKAELDVIFHGYARDEAHEQLIELLRPEATQQQIDGWGDGKTYLTVHRITSDYYDSANRYMKRPESGNFTDWEDDTNIPPVENITYFSEQNFDITPYDTIPFLHGWVDGEEDTDEVTAANKFGELVWDITELVRGWVNNDFPNYGLMIWMDPALSLNEQVNFVTIETDDSNRGFSAPDGAPILRLTSATPAPQWAGYDFVDDNNVDTLDFMGFLWVPEAGDFVWSYSLSSWMYLPEEQVTESGAWTYIVK